MAAPKPLKIVAARRPRETGPDHRSNRGKLSVGKCQGGLRLFGNGGRKPPSGRTPRYSPARYSRGWRIFPRSNYATRRDWGRVIASGCCVECLFRIRCLGTRFENSRWIEESRRRAAPHFRLVGLDGRWSMDSPQGTDRLPLPSVRCAMRLSMNGTSRR